MENELLPGAVMDWGGFEKLVAEINRTATDIKIEHNAKLSDRFGVERQIDVAIRYKVGLVEHLDVCECKYWKRAIPREKVDAFKSTVDQLNASRGIIFSAAGFQSGAVETARATGILLFKVREPTPGEWGSPGRVVDMYLVAASRSIANTEMSAGSTNPENPQGVTIDTRLGGADETLNQIRVGASGRLESLESTLRTASFEAGKQLLAKQYAEGRPLFGGRSGERLIRASADVPFLESVQLVARPDIYIASIRFAIGITITQSHLVIDRAKNYTFALAIEDCVSNTVTLAARRHVESITSLSEPASDVVLIEGKQMISYWVTDLQPFSDFENLAHGQILDRSLPVELQTLGVITDSI